MSEPFPAKRSAGAAARPKAWVALLLAFVAGCVDTLAFQALGDGFASHMSGNTVHAALGLAHGSWSLGLYRLLPLPGFVLGAALGRALADWGRTRGHRHRLSRMLLLECGLLAGAYGAQRSPTVLAILLCAAALGLQSAALRHVAGHRLRTTFITGMLVALADESVALWLQGQRERRDYVWLHAAVWAAFMCGAILAGLAWSCALALAYAPIAGVLALLIIWDRLSPLDIASS